MQSKLLVRQNSHSYSQVVKPEKEDIVQTFSPQANK
jgi:hypothetical protein